MVRSFTRALLLLCLSCATPVFAASDIAAKLDAYMAARTRLGQFSGTVLVARNGKVLLNKGYGYASYEQLVPNSPRTRYFVASITKQFTAAAILQLRDAGKFALSDSICRWVDACPDTWRPVTINTLLDHSSGVPDYEDDLKMLSPDYDAFMSRPDNIDKILESARSKPLDFAPGTKFKYSNTGYLLLSKVISRASGQPYADYVEQHVLAAAGMRDSGVYRGLAVRNAASGYLAQELPIATIAAGVPLTKMPLSPAPYTDFSGEHGDGNIYSTAADMLKWYEALDSGRVLRPSSVAEMRKPEVGTYGYGTEIGANFGHPLIGHGGNLPGFVSRVDWYPREKVAVIVLSNLMSTRYALSARALAAIVFGQPYDIPQAHRIVAVEPAAYKPLFGKYAFDGEAATVSYNGRFLTIDVPGMFTAGLLPTTTDKFYVPFFDGTAQVVHDKTGAPTALRLHYEGKDHLVPKISGSSSSAAPLLSAASSEAPQAPLQSLQDGEANDCFPPKAAVRPYASIAGALAA